MAPVAVAAWWKGVSGSLLGFLSRNGGRLELLGALSILTFLGSLLVIPWLILRMKPDYFIRHRRDVLERHRRHPVLATVIFFIRNISGMILLTAGVVMLVLPGQGLLTMLIGFSFLDFPGKNKLLDKIIQNRRVRQSLNWIRKKGGREEFIFE